MSCSQPQQGVTSTPLFCDNGVNGRIEEPTILLSSSAQPSCLASGLLTFILWNLFYLFFYFQVLFFPCVCFCCSHLLKSLLLWGLCSVEPYTIWQMNKTCHIASACFSVICESVSVCVRSLYLQFVLWFWFYVNMRLRVKTLSCSIVYSVRNPPRSVLIHSNKTEQLLQYLTRLDESNLTSETQWKLVNRCQDGNITLQIKHSFLSSFECPKQRGPWKVLFT